MNNRTAPSVRRHPPALVCSLLPSVPCHGLAPAACLPSTFFLGMERRCFVSVRLYLSVSLSFFSSPFFLFSFYISFSLFSSSRTCWPIHPNQTNKQIMWEKRGQTKKGKRMFCHQGNKGRSNLSSSLLASDLCLPSSWCGILPSSLFSILRCLFSSGSQLLCLVC